MCGSSHARFGRAETKYFVGATEIPRNQIREISQVQFARLFPNRRDGFTAKSGAKREKLDDRAFWSEAKLREFYESEAQRFFDPPKWMNKDFVQKKKDEIARVGGVGAWVKERIEDWGSVVGGAKFLVTAGSPPQAIERVVKWEQKEKQTMCGARCRNARGPNCDCVCEGKFHGQGVAMSRAHFAEIDLKPTSEMATNAERGLALREKHGKGGTAVGVARARDIKNRANLSPETVKRMHAFFSRHEGNQKGGEDDAGYIAWLLWGGDAGKAWAARKVEQIDKTTNRRTNMRFAKPKLDTAQIASIAKSYGEKARQRGVRRIADDDQYRRWISNYTKALGLDYMDPTLARARTVADKAWSDGWDEDSWDELTNGPKFKVGDKVFTTHLGRRRVVGKVVRVNRLAKPEPEYIIDFTIDPRGGLPTGRSQLNIAQSSLTAMARSSDMKNMKKAAFAEPKTVKVVLTPKGTYKVVGYDANGREYEYGLLSDKARAEQKARDVARYKDWRFVSSRSGGKSAFAHPDDAKITQTSLIRGNGRKYEIVSRKPASPEARAQLGQTEWLDIRGANGAIYIVQVFDNGTYRVLSPRGKAWQGRVLASRSGGKSAFGAWREGGFEFKTRTLGAEQVQLLVNEGSGWMNAGVVADEQEARDASRGYVKTRNKGFVYIGGVWQKAKSSRSGGKARFGNADAMISLANGYISDGDDEAGSVLADLVRMDNRGLLSPDQKQTLKGLIREARAMGVYSRSGGKSAFAATIEGAANYTKRLIKSLGFYPDAIKLDKARNLLVLEFEAAIIASNAATKLWYAFATRGSGPHRVAVNDEAREGKDGVIGIVEIDLSAVAAKGLNSRSGGKTRFGVAEIVHRDGTVHLDFAAFKNYISGKDESALRYMMKDASQALRAMPKGSKSSYYADVVSEIGNELRNRGVKMSRSDGNYFTTRAYMGSTIVGERSYDTLREAEFYGKQMLSAWKSKPNARDVRVDIDETRKYESHGTVKTLSSRSGMKSTHAAEVVKKLSGGWVIEREGGVLYLAKGSEAIPVPSVERAIELHKAQTEGRLVRRTGGFMSRSGGKAAFANWESWYDKDGESEIANANQLIEKCRRKRAEIYDVEVNKLPHAIALMRHALENKHAQSYRTAQEEISRADRVRSSFSRSGGKAKYGAWREGGFDFKTRTLGEEQVQLLVNEGSGWMNAGVVADEQEARNASQGYVKTRNRGFVYIGGVWQKAKASRSGGKAAFATAGQVADMFKTLSDVERASIKGDTAKMQTLLKSLAPMVDRDRAKLPKDAVAYYDEMRRKAGMSRSGGKAAFASRVQELNNQLSDLIRQRDMLRADDRRAKGKDLAVVNHINRILIEIDRVQDELEREKRSRSSRSGGKAKFLRFKVQIFHGGTLTGTLPAQQFMEYARKFVPNVSRSSFLEDVIAKFNEAAERANMNTRAELQVTKSSRSGGKAAFASRPVDASMWSDVRRAFDSEHDAEAWLQRQGWKRKRVLSDGDIEYTKNGSLAYVYTDELMEPRVRMKSGMTYSSRASRSGGKAAFARWEQEQTKKHGQPISEFTAKIGRDFWKIEVREAAGGNISASLYLWDDLRGYIAMGQSSRLQELQNRAESLSRNKEARAVSNIERIANYSRSGGKSKFAHWTESTRVVESLSYKNIRTGQTVSGGGAVPWRTEGEKKEWKPVRYFVFLDTERGTTFGGRYSTQAQAQSALDKAKREHAAEVAKYETAPAIRKRMSEIEGELAGLENSPSAAGRIPRMDRLKEELNRLRGQLKSLGFSRTGEKSTNAAPKFKIGERVKIMDGGKVIDSGVVSFVGQYDDYLGEYRYKVQTATGRKNWNESSLARFAKSTNAKAAFASANPIANKVAQLMSEGATRDQAVAFAADARNRGEL